MKTRREHRPADSDALRTHPYVALLLLTLVITLNAVDRQLVAVLAEPIKRDLHLSDGQLGLLSGLVFAAFYTVFGIPIAWVSDRLHRVRLIALACSLWSVFSGLCGLAVGFWSIALARVGVAVGEAGGSPPSYSLISDYFPPERRGTALAVFSVGAPFGMALAIAGGGQIAASYGWRAAFFAAAAPGIVVAFLLVLLVQEPRRGRLDGGVQTESAPPLLETIRMFLTTSELRWVTIAASLSVFASHGVIAWMPAFLLRVQGMTLTEMAQYYSVISGGGMIFGSLVAGRLADAFMRRGRYLVPLIPAVANIAAWPMVMAAVWSSSWAISLACLIVPMIGFWTFLPVSLLLIQNGVAANQRATCGSLLLFAVGIIGIGGGATYVGYISDFTVARYGEASLKIAFVALLPIFLAAFGAFLLTARAIRRRDAAKTASGLTLA